MVVKKTNASGKAAAEIIDFSNVKDRGNFNPKHIDSGDYTAKIAKVEQTESKAGDKMWVFHITLDEVPRAVYPHYCVLTDNQYWKIKALFTASGINVGQRKVKVDPNKLIGKSIGVGIEDDEYEGRLKSVIVDVFPADEVDGPDEEEEPEEDEIEEAPKRKKKPAPVEEDDEEDEEVEEEEEEEEAPAPKKAPAKKAPARKKPAVVEEDDEEDEDELEIDEL